MGKKDKHTGEASAAPSSRLTPRGTVSFDSGTLNISVQAMLRHTLVPSAPRVEVRRRAAAHHPSHERPVIGAIAQSSDQPGKGPVDELLRPVIRCEADSEIHEVYLDLPPPMEGQLCNRVLTASHRSDLVVPEIIRE